MEAASSKGTEEPKELFHNVPHKYDYNHTRLLKTGWLLCSWNCHQDSKIWWLVLVGPTHLVALSR
jgi:hypothetical protein